MGNDITKDNIYRTQELCDAIAKKAGYEDGILDKRLESEDGLRRDFLLQAERIATGERHKKIQEILDRKPEDTAKTPGKSR